MLSENDSMPVKSAKDKLYQAFAAAQRLADMPMTALRKYAKEYDGTLGKTRGEIIEIILYEEFDIETI